jgi:hypothetical protein
MGVDRRDISASLWETMPQLHKSIMEFDVGYATNPIYNINWLEERMSRIIMPRIDTACKSSLNRREREAVNGFVAFKIEKIAIGSWVACSKALVEEIENKINDFTDNELKEWIENEGSNVMDFNLFKLEFEKNVIELSYSLHDIGVKTNILTSRVKSTAAKLWGLSDSYCKIRSLNV